MTSYVYRRWVLLLLATLALVAVANTAWADAVGDFNRLLEQYRKQNDAGRYQQAHETALDMRRLAEGPLRDEPARLAMALRCQGIARVGQGRYAEAEPLYKRALEIAQKTFGEEDPNVVAIDLNNLADLYRQQGRYAKAELLFKRALEIGENVLGKEHPDVADRVNNLALVCFDQGRYTEAERLYRRALKAFEMAFGQEHGKVTMVLTNLANLHMAQGRYAEAEPLCERALEIDQKTLGEEHLVVAKDLNNLAVLYVDQARYTEAEPLHRRALEIRQKALGPAHPETAGSLNNLALLYTAQGRYGEAEPLYKRSLAMRVKVFGPEHPDVATSLNNLALLYRYLGRYAEAESLLARALRIDQMVFGEEHRAVARDLMNLANGYRVHGRYAEAAPLFKRALTIQQRILDSSSPGLAHTFFNLGSFYLEQGRVGEAETNFQWALKIYEKALGSDNLDVAKTLNMLALAYLPYDLNAEARPLLERSLAIREKLFGPNDLRVASVLKSLATLLRQEGDLAEAERMLLRALRIAENALGGEQTVAVMLQELALLYNEVGRFADAIQTLDREITMSERQSWARLILLAAYWLRAELTWRVGRRSAAVKDLEKAVGIAETHRANVAGGDYERTREFGRASAAFQRLALWQAEMGKLSESLRAIERGRARMLLDQMEIHDVDLLAGVPRNEADLFRRVERDAQTRMASLGKQLDVLAQQENVSADQRQAEREKLQVELRQARQDYMTARADMRDVSPVYRRAVGREPKPATLDELKKWAADRDALFLEYLLSDDDGCVLIVPPSETPRVEKLAADAQQAQVLGIEPGPLTSERIQTVLSNDQGTGVASLLRASETKQDALALSVLWKLLIPKSERTAILDGKYKRLVVLPDGPLSQLPFETLVVEPGDDPEYLLDLGLPIQYAPSATILMNLANRAEEKSATDVPPILTIGDCRYDHASHVDSGDIVAQLAPRNRYAAVGGQLKPLPHTKTEIRWVAKVFGNKEIPVAWLRREMATERIVRGNVSGRRILHFACHGLVDQAYGNLFGSLALTPGPKADNTADDGFLTLAEIYELDLKGCELAILSACDTNAGPEQRGEGVWALSRGFLVAGARRVVASNWLVDDEAAASLVSYFCGGIAQAEAKGAKPDYAKCLHEAKRFIRKQEKWKSPYYWAPFVLVGPS